MQVNELPNYGKDILTISDQSRVPLKKRLQLILPALEMIGKIIQNLGIRVTIHFLGDIKSTIKYAETLDWSSLKARGISEENLKSIIHKIVVAKVMADTLGMEKAAELRRNLSQRISIPVFSEMFTTPETFLEIGKGDFLPPFKKYYIAMAEAMKEKGLEESIIVTDTPDEFQLNVVYCAWAEVARVLGNPAYCYYSTCYGDEVYFPYLSEKCGFAFSRSGTLALGKPYCDMKFTRKNVVSN